MTASSRLLRCLALLVCVAVANSSSSLPLVGVDGLCKPQAQVASFVAASKIGASATTSAVGVVDVSNSGCKLVNSLLKTSFPDAHVGICLDLSSEAGGAAVLLAQYDSMFSTSYCGSKAADFLGSLANTLIVMLPSSMDAAEVMSAHDQTLRRLASAIQARADTDKAVKALYFVAPPSSDGNNHLLEIVQAFETVWNDVGESNKLSLSTTIDVRAFGSEDELALKEALAKAAASATTEYPVDALAERLVDAWNPIGSSTPRPLFSAAQRQSIFLIESAFSTGVAHSEAAFSQWQARIGKGKVVGKFGSRVQDLLDSVHERFMSQTKGSISVRERAQRARQLRDNIETVAVTLFKQQLTILQSQTTNRFRRMLINLAAVSQDGEESAKEDEQQALRKALFDFRAFALDLEVEILGLSSSTAQSELSSSLQSLLTEFPESTFGRLESVKKLERETTRPKKRKGGKGKGRGAGSKGGKAINIGLNLVGMLRPPGTGNLQGYGSYSTALLGLPLDLLLGVQNDGDSPEIMGEDREFPLLRLQPKLNFDIDCSLL